MIPIPSDFLSKVAAKETGERAKKQGAIIQAIEPHFADTLEKYGIDTLFRVAHFTGQICEESDQFCTTEEYASGEAYEGRRDLGNIHSGDGVRYKGRGLIQLTGLVNYELYGPMIGLNLVAHPEAAAGPVTALQLACLYWVHNRLNFLADLDHVEEITRKINGGLNGLEEREDAVDRAFDALGYTTG